MSGPWQHHEYLAEHEKGYAVLCRECSVKAEEYTRCEVIAARWPEFVVARDEVDRLRAENLELAEDADDMFRAAERAAASDDAARAERDEARELAGRFLAQREEARDALAEFRAAPDVAMSESFGHGQRAVDVGVVTVSDDHEPPDPSLPAAPPTEDAPCRHEWRVCEACGCMLDDNGIVYEPDASGGSMDAALAARAETAALKQAITALCDRNGYTTWDQEARLGDRPWMHDDPDLIAWEDAHGHDARTKCYAEYGCQLLIDPDDLRALLEPTPEGTEREPAPALLTAVADALCQRDGHNMGGDANRPCGYHKEAAKIAVAVIYAERST